MNPSNSNPRSLDLSDVRIEEEADARQKPKCGCDIAIVNLMNVSGYVNLLLDRIKCETLQIKNVTLEPPYNSSSLVEMLKFRVQRLNIDLSSTDSSFLLGYDGKGQCESIRLIEGCEKKERVKNCLSSWAESVCWTVKTSSGMMIFERPK